MTSPWCTPVLWPHRGFVPSRTSLASPWFCSSVPWPGRRQCRQVEPVGCECGYIYYIYIYICGLETFQESTNIRPYISPGVHWYFTSDVLQLWFLTVSKKYTYHQNEHVSLNTKKMVSANGIKHPPSWGIFWVLLNATPPPLKKTWSLVTGLLRDLN